MVRVLFTSRVEARFTSTTCHELISSAVASSGRFFCCERFRRFPCDSVSSTPFRSIGRYRCGSMLSLPCTLLDRLVARRNFLPPSPRPLDVLFRCPDARRPDALYPRCETRCYRFVSLTSCYVDICVHCDCDIQPTTSTGLQKSLLSEYNMDSVSDVFWATDSSSV